MTVTLRARTLTAATSAAVLLGVLVPAGAATAAPDTEPPVGSFVVLSASSSDDPGPLAVDVVQNSLKDDQTATGDIVREVNWGTGVGYEPWHKGSSISFAYTSVGKYDLKVRVTDESGNRSVSDLGTVVVSDAFAPKLAVNRPASDRHRAWRSVRGYARDVGLAGMDFVRVKAWQHRARGWYAYQGEDRGWVRTDTRARAKDAAIPVRVPPSTNGAWKASLRGVRNGALVVRSFARDAEGNRSKAVVVRRTLVD